MCRHHYKYGISAAARQQRGLAIVELAIVLPVVIFLLLAVAEFGNAFMHYNTLTRAVRDGTRFCAGKALAGQSGVVNIDSNLQDETQKLVVYGNVNGTGPPVLPNFTAGNVAVSNPAGTNEVTVIASYDYAPIITPLLPNFSGGSRDVSFTMQAQVTMRAI